MVPIFAARWRLPALGFGLGLAFALAAGSASLSGAPALPPQPVDGRLIPAYQSDRIWNGVTLTGGGRVFVAFPGDGPGIQLGEINADGKAVPYPDAAWNGWIAGQDQAQAPKAAFVHVNALRIGPDGKLWVVDAGAPGIGKAAVPGGARLIRFDLVKNAVEQIYPLQAGVKPKSFIDDFRFNGENVYLTDAGEPALLVLNMRTGVVRRLLDGDVSTTDHRPVMADGKVLRDEKGKPVWIHADQIEVAPDGHEVYYQPASGPMSRIAAGWLDDSTLDPATIGTYVEPWLDTPTAGGTAIDAEGSIYLTDPNHRRILKIARDKTVTTLVADPRLIWADALWIDHDGFLWIPATQMNLGKGLNNGKSEIRYPVWIYKMKIGVGPAPNDHS
ncbi:Major royal jelly protein [Verrucomicrobium sp. GAS474]|uniref:L-dopachrome tautomerase-related protein n=1 Tax=Verrucomicrobium sp. GAS474 TaxID=1882831 RepID=UPI00087DB650|nr:L-dopachrome tautomerase-related protein [Verrucomicrobium sp. GAS474]SDU15721.1 Major royal jelly protein [Verrucomicrobium sp. GAS474]